MITIKLPYKSTEEFNNKLLILRKQYSNVVRYSYNRFNDNFTEKNIRTSFSKLNHINELDAWTKQCAILEAKVIKFKNKDIKVIFGGKYNFIQALKNKLSNDQIKDKRLLALNIYGQKAEHGNRKFKLDIIQNNTIIYKHKIKEHYSLILPELHSNYKKQLYKLQELNESNGYTYQIKLDEKYIYFSFEEITTKEKLINSRYIGIDLNPMYIGISIKDNDDILFTKCYNLTKITNKITNLKASINSNKFKHLNDKLNTEVLEISKNISEIGKYYKCKFIFIEDLNFKKSNKSKQFNRLTKNLWKRNIFINNLEKRCKICNQKLFKVNSIYTSIIGNLQYDFVDPINASIEIGRRGYDVIILKNKKFYPTFWLKESLKHQWKEKISDIPDNWKGLFILIKNSKLRYRVSTDSVVFRKFKHNKSLVLNN